MQERERTMVAYKGEWTLLVHCCIAVIHAHVLDQQRTIFCVPAKLRYIRIGDKARSLYATSSPSAFVALLCCWTDSSKSYWSTVGSIRRTFDSD